MGRLPLMGRTAIPLTPFIVLHEDSIFLASHSRIFARLSTYYVCSHVGLIANESNSHVMPDYTAQKLHE